MNILKKEPLSKEAADAQIAKMIEIGLQQIDEGKVISNKIARQRIKALLSKR